MTHSMTDCGTRQDRFDKADEAFNKACRENADAYDAWSDSCARLRRINKERLAAWKDLVACHAEGEEPKR